ncbi:hydrogenase maturation nickel metallochaperone HypA [uncultured Roseivirga sp.]|jgi:hydrogenase nickel incorporation protein HypA/HybF|uniref:hydrogenase maturation nickel metallochaperone HypA/HybF n=1 Tax=Ekhidna sp. TaxID=2608089 RepID=UPI002582D091|nr:hydrogenase maturation nickel metallochaperone HypA [uncultured Roseivirga sp.]|tara:strand:- start:221 stop:565 length:345 start_codon:yes stop_codon:yes gene_type:complete
MHEISLVRNILKTLEAEFEKDELEKLSRIDLKVGLLSNVEPILIQNAFEAVIQDEQRFQNAELYVNLVPIIIKCEICGDESEVKNYTFKCRNGHPTKNILQGEELTIERVHFID